MAKKNEEKKRFKFKEMKVYGSLENFFGNQKNYRIVFDETEVCYVNVELQLFNILFDEEEWKTKVKIKASEYYDNKEMCNIDKDIIVTPDQNVIMIREGWGTPNPGWWKKGTYKWEVFLDDVLVGTNYFYITANGQVTASNNPYFDFNTIKLFNSPKGTLAREQRKYMTAFNKDTAQYISIELDMNNKITHEKYFPLELNLYFYNDTRQLKGACYWFEHVNDSRKNIVMDVGYGAEGTGFWYPDKYTCEVVFMDNIVAIVPFEVGTADIELTGTPVWLTNIGQGDQVHAVVAEQTDEATFESAKKELDELIGLQTVKTEINELTTYLKFLKIRQEKGFEEKNRINLNMVFTGNPGTGKTTVARMLGKIYKALGLLKRPDVTEVGRVDLVAEYIGQTAPKTKAAIDRARGGILFIDEAYALSDRGDDGKDFGKEVIEVIIKEMSDGPGDVAFIFAGYPKEMRDFLNSNPGLSSRVAQVINFPDYNPDELMDIAAYDSNKRGVKISEEAKNLVYMKVVEAYRNRDNKFGNARYVNSIIEEAKQNMALRLMKSENPENLTNEDLSTINLIDVEEIFGMGIAKKSELPIDEVLLQDAMSQLKELTGMANVKNEIEETVKLVRYYKEIGRDVKKSFSLHTVFTGNPGTGKTTVARILVKIFKALGILERGHLIETDREGMVAGYVGQTAIKADSMIEAAMGGGLFIDEAYALSQGGENDFGREAIETLLKRMEDHRGEFIVIVAGYTENMARFLESNPGLKSRFDKFIHFEDYQPEELFEITANLLNKEFLFLNEEAATHLKSYIGVLVANRNKYFGNARTMRKIVADIVHHQNLRMAGIPAAQRTPEMIKTVTIDDVKGFTVDGELNTTARESIGFKLGAGNKNPN
ncbi:MAG: AAA family ATPase [Chitinophagales bacterium]|nr:AAA family ATPase [Bacteroidota bacterium]